MARASVDWKQARDSAKLAGVVSPVLMLINHYDELARGRWTGLGIKAGLTFLVPFLVSFYSGTTAAQRSRGKD